MKIKLWMIAVLIITILSCNDDSPEPLMAEYDSTPYVLRTGSLPVPDLPQDNLLTEQGVLLGKMLFFEERLSRDNSQSCASCHRQVDGFSDTARVSIGVEGLGGRRQAMPIFNMAWNTNGFFWDGRAELLRHQALLPIQDPLEMDETLDRVLDKLSADRSYKEQFIRAFGDEEISTDRIALALEQFMLSIVSLDSKYDRYLAGMEALTPSEDRGRELFFTEYNPFFPDDSGADCQHCHSGKNFENDQYLNNGLDADADFVDLGRAEVTKDPSDNAKFKVPSLRNVAVTAPYMHDGRFTTLEEVIDHYNSGLQPSSTIDPAIEPSIGTGLLLTDDDKVDLINFLKTLTDQVYLNNPEYFSPL